MEKFANEMFKVFLYALSGVGVYKLVEQQSVMKLLQPSCIAQENRYIDGQDASRWMEQQMTKKGK